MITAERLRRCRGADEVIELFRELGYPVERVDVDRAEWRRGGVTIPWNGAPATRCQERRSTSPPRPTSPPAP